jgi:hypothetical protein
MSLLVSFPRSGQHLVEKILKFICKEHDVKFTYCEFYTCCNSLPCKKGKEFSKNHDFDLNLEVNNDIKYACLYREDIILQLEAYYRFSIGQTKIKYKYKDLLKFIKDKSTYYNDFKSKWINNKNKNILKVEYYEILENPEKISKKIFKHFFPDIKIKNSVFKKLVDIELEVNNTPGVGNFKHKISLINQLDDKIYKKLKKDLNL